jgi:hypothetical protein
MLGSGGMEMCIVSILRKLDAGGDCVSDAVKDIALGGL